MQTMTKQLESVTKEMSDLLNATKVSLLKDLEDIADVFDAEYKGLPQVLHR